MPADSDDEIIYNGFRRVDLDKSAGHRAKLEEDGLVFCGFSQQHFEKELPHSPSSKPAPDKTINLVSDEDSDDSDRRRSRAPRTSKPASTPSSSATTWDPQSSRYDSARVSDKTPTSIQRHVSAAPRQSIRPSSSASLSKRGVPGEFMLPKAAKRQRNDAHGQPSKPVSQPVTKRVPKRKYTAAALDQEAAALKEPEAIVISSDEEEEPVPKKLRREIYTARTSPKDVDPMPASEDEWVTLLEDSRSDDSEVDYEYAHDALNMYRRGNWKKSVYPVEQALHQNIDISTALTGMSISSDQSGEVDDWQARRRRGRNSSGRSMIVSAYSDYYVGMSPVWTMSRAFHQRRSSTDHFHSLRHLRPILRLKQAPGGVNRIVQSKGTIAVASSASGGHEDPDNSGPTTIDPYNRDGALSVWYEGEQYVLPAHRRTLDRDDLEYSLEPARKHYAVQDVQFNPVFQHRVASSANDRTVRIWDCNLLPQSEGGSRRALVHTVRCTCTMGKLLFKPEEPVLAMGAHDGVVYLLRDDGGEKGSPTPQPSPLHLSRRNDETGDIAWGLGVQSDKLFASSMTREEKGFSGTHKVFDAQLERTACTLRLSEAGDSIAVHPAGTTAAIATKSAKHAHSLYLFDAARLNSNAVQNIELDSFHQSVTTTKFSPDGVYLALARDDNTTDVYDSRFLSRGKLHAFTHEPGNVFAYSKDIYGVVEMQWVEGHPSGLGLVTGGCDGAVRLWDVRLASDDPENGVIIAQCEHDLGHFSLGNIYENEMPLVTGEMSGKVTVFDRRRRD